MYRNLAIEDFLVNQYCKKEEIILFLWQNDNSVVLGRNQSANIECDLEYAHNNHILIGRRLSGGGAVFHDKGNLNYTFVSPNELFSREVFGSIVIQSLRNCGLNAEHTGRNDIVIDGLKVSGMAYYEGKDCSFLHGCLMVDVNVNILEKVLTVPSGKIESKGIKSLRARVRNLNEFKHELNIGLIKKNIIQTARDALTEKKDSFPVIDAATLPTPNNLLNKYSSELWIYGRRIPFKICLSKRFIWGKCDFILSVEGETITEVIIYTDALETEIFMTISEVLKGCAFKRKAMLQRLEGIESLKDQKSILVDMERMIQEEFNIND